MDKVLTELTDKYKTRLNAHVKELYIKHTTEWHTAQQERLDEDAFLNWTRTRDLMTQFEAYMQTMREQNERNHTVETLPGTLRELNDIVTEQRTLVETLQRTVVEQIRDQITRHDANTGAMAYLLDNYT